MKSIIQDGRYCYLCGSPGPLQLHHCLHGPYRSKADEDGLVVWLCVDCHTNLHQRGWDDKTLKSIAQTVWMRKNKKSVEEWIRRYGKNYKQ